MTASERLRNWVNCLRGRHTMVQYESLEGDVYHFCIWCGERG